jgi:hypothetical protein
MIFPRLRGPTWHAREQTEIAMRGLNVKFPCSGLFSCDLVDLTQCLSAECWAGGKAVPLASARNAKPAAG